MNQEPFYEQEPYKGFLIAHQTNTGKTALYYRDVLKNCRKYIKKEVYDATADDLRGYLLYRQKLGVAIVTLKTYKGVLQSFFNYLADEDGEFKRPENMMRKAAKRLNLKGGEKTKRKALNQDQRQKVLDAINWKGDIKEWQKGLAILFGFKQAFRKFEIAKVSWQDINFETNEITVLGKGNKERTIPLTGIIKERLLLFKAMMDGEGIESKWVFFCSYAPSNHWGDDWIYDAYKEMGRRAGFGKEVLFSTHDGRRIACTTLYEKGLTSMEAKEFSRHEQAATYEGYVGIEKSTIVSKVQKAID